MNKFLKSRLLRSMLPYFILGIGLLIAHRLISEVTFFTGELRNFLTVITPFLAGAVIAYILNMPCSAIERQISKVKNDFVKRKSWPLSVLSLFIIIVLIFVLILNLIIPAISRSIAHFFEYFHVYEATFRQWMANLEDINLPDFFPEINEDAIISMLLEFVQGFDFEELLAGAIMGLGGAALAVFRAFIAVIASIYMLLEKKKIKAFVTSLIAAVVSDEANATILKYAGKLNHNFHRYISTQTIDGLILGTAMTIVLLLFGSPYALLLGIMLGIFNYVPYFGSIVGTMLAVIVLAFTEGLGTAGLAAIVMFIIQQIDGNVIQPKLMGGSFSISPLLIIVSVTIGNFYAGILGMLVAIPIVAILKDVLDDYIVHLAEKKKAAPDPRDSEFMDRDIF